MDKLFAVNLRVRKYHLYGSDALNYTVDSLELLWHNYHPLNDNCCYPFEHVLEESVVNDMLFDDFLRALDYLANKSKCHYIQTVSDFCSHTVVYLGYYSLKSIPYATGNL